VQINYCDWFAWCVVTAVALLLLLNFMAIQNWSRPEFVITFNGNRVCLSNKRGGAVKRIRERSNIRIHAPSPLIIISYVLQFSHPSRADVFSEKIAADTCDHWKDWFCNKVFTAVVLGRILLFTVLGTLIIIVACSADFLCHVSFCFIPWSLQVHCITFIDRLDSTLP